MEPPEAGSGGERRPSDADTLCEVSTVSMVTVSPRAADSTQPSPAAVPADAAPPSPAALLRYESAALASPVSPASFARTESRQMSGGRRLSQTAARLLQSFSVSFARRSSLSPAQRIFTDYFCVAPGHAGTGGGRQNGPGRWEVLHSYPKDPQRLLCAHPRVPDFCFPDPAAPPPLALERFTFTLTDGSGDWLYGFAARAPSGVCHCILSCHPWFSLFNTVLQRAASQHNKGEQPSLVYELYRMPLPRPGDQLHVPVADGAVIALRRPDDAGLQLIDAPIGVLFAALSPETVISLLAAALEERRILFSSADPHLLCAASHALAALLYPLRWPHVFVPLLPLPLLDAVCTPTPLIAGVPAALLPRVLALPHEELVVCKLDSGTIHIARGVGGQAPAPLSRLPGAQRLRDRLQVALSSGPQGTPPGAAAPGRGGGIASAMAHRQRGAAPRRAPPRAVVSACEVLLCFVDWFAATFAALRAFAVPVTVQGRQVVLAVDGEAFDATVEKRYHQFHNTVRKTAMMQLWLQQGMRGWGAQDGAVRRRLDVFRERAARQHPGLFDRDEAAMQWCARQCPSNTRADPGSPKGLADRVRERFRHHREELELRRTGNPYRRGQAVHARRDGAAVAATVTALRGRLVRVHFDGLSEEAAEWVDHASDRLIPAAASPRTRVSADQPLFDGVQLAVLREGRWRGSTIVSSDRHQVLVHFDGCGEAADEWIPRDSARLGERL